MTLLTPVCFALFDSQNFVSLYLTNPRPFIPSSKDYATERFEIKMGFSDWYSTHTHDSLDNDVIQELVQTGQSDL